LLPHRENLAASTIVGAFALSTLIPAIALLLHKSTGMTSGTFFASWWVECCHVILVVVICGFELIVKPN
jgi:hypothetical protein